MTTFTDQIYQSGGMLVANGIPPFTGKAWFVDPIRGADGNKGDSPKRALATLYQAHNKAADGNNDVVFLVGNGLTTGAARLSKELNIAANINAAVAPTTGKLTWSKNALHLIGISAPGHIAQRSRIAPPTGVYTQANFGGGDLFEVSGTGCYFSNVEFYHAFSTGGVNQVCVTDSGGRNVWNRCSFFGKGDAASAADTGSYSLKVSGAAGESLFVGCTIGLDLLATARSAGAAEIQFLNATARNKFERCIIATHAAAAGCFWVNIGAGGIDRYVMFQDCVFSNPTLGGPAATAMTVGMSINAAPGGVVLLPGSMSYGATKITASGLAFTNFPAAAAGGGLGVAIV